MKTVHILQVLDWIKEAGAILRESINEDLIITEKSGALDLVTDMDQKIEQFFVQRIREHYPGDQILGEEGMGDPVHNLDGRVWILDPIDGTMNFIKQKENFAIMIGIVEDGIGKYGFLYDVIRERLIWGGPGSGVYYNDKPLPPPQNTGLNEGLVAINWQMYGKNEANVQELAWNSCGVRTMSCAGVEFIQLLLGKQVVYVSILAPWDFAAGRILCEALGLHFSKLNGETFGWLEKTKAIFATPKAYKSAMLLLKGAE